MPHSQPVYVIAEVGVNHNGSKERAIALIDAAAEAGANAVKFQTFNAKKLAAASAPKAAYQKANDGTQSSQLEMLQQLELPHAWHLELRDYSRAKGLDFMSTAFDEESFRLLLELEVPAVKVPSGELTNGPLLWAFARHQLPLFVSTGMATLSEVEQALAIICHAFHADAPPQNLLEVWQAWARPEWRAALPSKVTLLHCTSQYPTAMEEVNLRSMTTLGDAFHLPIGYSDHTEGPLISLAAVARGARVIEKHFTLDRTLPGPDHKGSLEPGELKDMVSQIRALEVALGDPIKSVQTSEWNTRLAARQQLVAAQDIAAGQTIRAEDLGTRRCGGGRPAVDLWGLVGATAKRAYAAGEPIAHDEG